MQLIKKNKNNKWHLMKMIFLYQPVLHTFLYLSILLRLFSQFLNELFQKIHYQDNHQNDLKK
jgi:hypothetical protein